MSCMVCRKSDVRLFNVGSNYGKINHTVGDDFNEIYGEKVKLYLTPDSCVCNVCMNILDNVAKLTQYIWNVISNPYNQPQPSKLSKFWKIFASLKLEGDDDDDDALLVPSYSVPYNKKLEEQIAERERNRNFCIPPTSERSLGVQGKRMSSGTISGYSVTDYSEVESEDFSEVRRIFKRKKKRGHNWAKSKGGRSRSATSSVTRKSGRKTYTPYTEYTEFSAYSDTSSKRKFRSSNLPRTSSTYTRSLSRLEAESRENLSNIYCMERNCNMFSDDIEELNLHNIEEHAMSNVYNCLECPNVYTTSYLFNIHMKCHTYSFFCLMCGMEQQNSLELQKHLDEHLIYSVPCKYCDKSFLSKSLREEHIRQRHTGRRNRRIYKDRLIILDRIDKCSGSQEQTDGDKNEYEARYIFYTDMQIEDGDMDMTIENLKTKNIPVYTDEDEGITLEEEEVEEDIARTEEPEIVNSEISQTENIVIQETNIPGLFEDENIDET